MLGEAGVIGNWAIIYITFPVPYSGTRREMRNLISSLQGHNKQLKAELQRYKRKFKESQVELTKLKSSEADGSKPEQVRLIYHLQNSCLSTRPPCVSTQLSLSLPCVTHAMCRQAEGCWRWITWFTSVSLYKRMVISLFSIYAYILAINHPLFFGRPQTLHAYWM